MPPPLNPLGRSDNTLEELAQMLALSARVGERLNRKLAQEDGEDEFSYANTLLCLSAEVLGAFSFLVEAHRRKQVQHAAWAARNLLELSIWCEYCIQSESNARMFFCDKARDALGLVEAFEGLVAGGSNDAIDTAAASAKATFNTFFTAQSVEMDAEFKRVHKAAKDLGVVQERAFRYLNIVLSKFVHPTALIVNSAMDDAQKSGLVEMSYLLGRTLASASMEALEKIATSLADAEPC